ncbi:hypothetical protein [Streptomyces sp. NPDC094472]|uniref:hypothetical protein n=1 Tax=Streptomyces sp. NPDC094472 TaxID=3155080 RepID=UPI0033302D37
MIHTLAALDLATGQVYCRILKPWTAPPRNKHAEVRPWAARRAGLPTYGSWLNWIESEFAALHCFALNGIDHRTHDEQNAAIAAHIRWYNARTEPKNRFAPESPIRQWTEYPPKAAWQSPATAIFAGCTWVRRAVTA